MSKASKGKGLGLSEDEHLTKASRAANQAAHYRQVAMEKMRQGECRQAFENAAHAVAQGAVADTHYLSAGASEDFFNTGLATLDKVIDTCVVPRRRR